MIRQVACTRISARIVLTALVLYVMPVEAWLYPHGDMLCFEACYVPPSNLADGRKMTCDIIADVLNKHNATGAGSTVNCGSVDILTPTLSECLNVATFLATEIGKMDATSVPGAASIQHKFFCEAMMSGRDSMCPVAPGEYTGPDFPDDDDDFR